MIQLGEDAIDLGSYLKKNREAKGMTLESISARTRINIRFLTAIENNDFKVLPPAYMRAMIKTFAKEAGADMEQVNNDLESYFSAMGEIGESKVFPVDLGEEKKKEKWYKKYFMWVPTLATAGLILFGIKLCGESSQEIPMAVTEIPIDKVIEEVKSKQPPVSVTTQPSEEDLTSLPDMRLQLETVDRVWVRVITDSKDTSEYIFNSGAKKTFRGKLKFLVICGNAGGLKLRLNGRELEPIGEPGMVYSISIAKDGTMEKKKINPNRPIQ